MLVWIAYKLLLPEDARGGRRRTCRRAHASGARCRTVVVADAVMGLDNVLAVAGAAHGSFVLVVTGLLVSIPIVILGSTLHPEGVERYPAFVYVGAGGARVDRVKMMTSEPFVAAEYRGTSPRWWRCCTSSSSAACSGRVRRATTAGSSRASPPASRACPSVRPARRRSPHPSSQEMLP